MTADSSGTTYTERLSLNDAYTRMDPVDRIGSVDLSTLRTLEERAEPWLHRCLVECDSDSGALYRLDPGGPVCLAASNEQPTWKALIAEIVFSAHSAILPSDTSPTDSWIVELVKVDATIRGAFVVALSGNRPSELQKTRQRILWSLAWLREAIRFEDSLTSMQDAAALAQVQLMLARTLDSYDFKEAALQVVTRLALDGTVARASFGLRRGLRTDLHSISHSSEYIGKMVLNRAVVSAMDEAIDQRAVIVFPPKEDALHAATAHSELAHTHAKGAVASFPFLVDGEAIGAFTVEFLRDSPPDEATLQRIDRIAALIGPVLRDKYRSDRWVIAVAADALKKQLVRLFGKHNISYKVTALTLALIFALCSVWTDVDRVSGIAVAEGQIQRSVVVPYDGFLRSAPLQAGDTLHAGDIIAELDDREIAFERLRFESEQKQYEAELGRAIGEQDRAKAEVLRNRIEQARVQIALIDEMLSRSVIRAPFDGILVSGDQSQNIGNSVIRGDVLFEISPIGKLRVMTWIDETRIAELRVDQSGTLVVAALPGERFDIRVHRITPIAETIEGRNAFRVEARLIEDTALLRPGMKGIAKITLGEDLVVAIWSRSLRNWLRFQLWAWGG